MEHTASDWFLDESFWPGVYPFTLMHAMAASGEAMQTHVERNSAPNPYEDSLCQETNSP